MLTKAPIEASRFYVFLLRRAGRPENAPICMRYLSHGVRVRGGDVGKRCPKGVEPFPSGGKIKLHTLYNIVIVPDALALLGLGLRI